MAKPRSNWTGGSTTTNADWDNALALLRETVDDFKDTDSISMRSATGTVLRIINILQEILPQAASLAHAIRIDPATRMAISLPGIDFALPGMPGVTATPRPIGGAPAPAPAGALGATGTPAATVDPDTARKATWVDERAAKLGITPDQYMIRLQMLDRLADPRDRADALAVMDRVAQHDAGVAPIRNGGGDTVAEAELRNMKTVIGGVYALLTNPAIVPAAQVPALIALLESVIRSGNSNLYPQPVIDGIKAALKASLLPNVDRTMKISDLTPAAKAALGL